MSTPITMQNPTFIPGPTNMPEILRRAVDVPTMDHRSRHFRNILIPALEGVRSVLKTKDSDVFIFPTTGTGGWEVAISNVLAPGDRVLAARYGMFSHRWIDLCKRRELNVDVIEAPWGQGVPAERLAEALRADTSHKIKAVLVTHNETATGVLSDILSVRRALDGAKHPALLLVDGVSSIACMDFRMDEWGVDVAVTGSQKGFMLPVGLAIVAFSKKAMALAQATGLPRCFFDIRDMASGYAKGLYPYTPPIGLLNGLKLSSEMLLEEGLENVFIRHRRIADGIRAAIRAWGFELCAANPGLYSDTVSAVRAPAGFDTTALVHHAAQKYDVAFGVGLGELAGKVFRIGHLGVLSDVMALSGLATLEMAMADLGLPVRLGLGVAAAQEFYRSSTSLPVKAAA